MSTLIQYCLKDKNPTYHLFKPTCVMLGWHWSNDDHPFTNIGSMFACCLGWFCGFLLMCTNKGTLAKQITLTLKFPSSTMMYCQHLTNVISILAQCLHGCKTKIILLISPVSLRHQNPTIKFLCGPTLAQFYYLIRSTLPKLGLSWILIICWWHWQPLTNIEPMFECCLGWC